MVRYLWSLKDYWSSKGQPCSYLPCVAWQFHGLTEERYSMICCWTALLSVGQRSVSRPARKVVTNRPSPGRYPGRNPFPSS